MLDGLYDANVTCSRINVHPRINVHLLRASKKSLLLKGH